MDTDTPRPARPALVVPTRDEEIDLEWDDFTGDDPAAALDVFDIVLNESTSIKPLVLYIEEFWRIGRLKVALDLLHKALSQRKSDEHVPLLCMLATYSIALARRAPKLILPTPRNGKPLVHSTDPNHPESVLRPNDPPRTKEEYWTDAEQFLARADRLERSNKIVRDCKATLALARGKLDEASRLFDAILADEPTHLIALAGRARILFARRSFRPALKAYQQVLTLSPLHLPDPRIGIGLCFYMLGDKVKARKAWERSLAVHPDESQSATVLLGLSYLNAFRDPSATDSDFYNKGIGHLNVAFKKDNTIAAAAGPLATHFLSTEQYSNSIKLSERAVQFADAKALVAEGYLQIGRALQAQGNPWSQTAYGQALEVYPEQLVAKLATGQTLIKSGPENIPAAINLFEQILRNNPRCIEALLMLGSITTAAMLSAPGIADAAVERKKARELYDQVTRLTATEAKSARATQAATDVDFFVELARLWEDEPGVERTLGAFRHAVELERGGQVRPQLLNNVAVLEYQKGELGGAQSGLEEAFEAVGERVAGSGGTLSLDLDATLTTVSYNLGVVYEALGDKEKATEAYSQILSRHSEYVDAKARLALMALDNREFDKAHNLLKEALTSQPLNPEVRALYIYFLFKTGTNRVSLDFTIETLKMTKANTRQDIYGLCAAGMLYYIQARENRDTTKEAGRDRAARYLRAAEYYDKALKLDPLCAFAAQGLAISIAEGTIGTGVEATVLAPALTDAAQKAKNSRDALTILTKVKESLNEGSVYVNIGHCHFMRDEWEKAIESYDTASKKYFKEKDISTLLYLARAWYHKASHDQNFIDIQASLAAVRAALALGPKDLAVIFNLAMILQKGIEILSLLPPNRRTLAELNDAIANCEESLSLFQELVDDPHPQPPYPEALPKHRLRYGAGLLKKSADLIVVQKEHDAIESAKLEVARELREKERQRLAEAEAERQRELARQAEELAAQRRAMREEAAEWAAKRLGEESEGEEDKKKRKGEGKKRAKKTKKDDDASTGDDEKPAKPKRKKIKTEARADDQKMEVDGDESDEPVKPSKRKIGRGGKIFKSSEFVDSDDSSGDEGGDGDRVGGDASDES